MTAKKVRFDVTTYKKELTVKSLSLEHVTSIDLKSFHFCYAPCFNTLGYKNTKGNWVDISSLEKGIGPVAWPILQAIQLNAGIRLNKKILIELTGFSNLNNDGVLVQRIKALRTVFGEDKTTERLIITSKNGEFTAMWPKQATWIWIMPIP
jgi:hypothetical protein